MLSPSLHVPTPPQRCPLTSLPSRAAKDESLKAYNKEDTNKKRLEDRIRPFQLYVNEDTDNTGDCQFDAAADQLRGIAGHEHVTKVTHFAAAAAVLSAGCVTWGGFAGNCAQDCDGLAASESRVPTEQ
jgi:hypothetical protein